MSTRATIASERMADLLGYLRAAHTNERLYAELLEAWSELVSADIEHTNSLRSQLAAAQAQLAAVAAPAWRKSGDPYLGIGYVLIQRPGSDNLELIWQDNYTAPVAAEFWSGPIRLPTPPAEPAAMAACERAARGGAG